MIVCDAVLRTCAVVCLGAFAGSAHANPTSILPGGADPTARSLFHVTVDYAYTIDSSTVVREVVGTGADPNGPISLQDDLSFKQTRHVLVPRVELALLKDTFISFGVPIVISQSRELSLADGVARDSSTTVRDGLLTTDGFDAQDPGTPTAGNVMFRGENRRGVEQLYFGLAVAPMNQARDHTKPTWKLGGELRLAVGKVMRFDAMKADTETGVSRGVHELKLWTSFARQFERIEGYFDMWWQVPLTARPVSLYDDIDQTPGTFGATNTMPGQKAGIGFGLEAYAYDDRANKNRVSIDVGARVVGHFEGRDYSEMWEVFALAGDVRRNGPLVLDRNPVETDVQASSHPGITNIENYLETALRFGVRGQLGKRILFGVIVDLAWKTDHAITFADAGIDLPTCTGSRTTDCETESNDLVNPGTEEVNPLHAPQIDVVGHRYLSIDNFAFSIGVQAQTLF